MVNRLDRVTVSGSIGRCIVLAASRICIGHSFLTQYSSHVICVPITQRLSACSGEQPPLVLLSAVLVFFIFLSFLFLSILFLLICFARPRGTRERIYLVAWADFLQSLTSCGNHRLSRAVMNVEIFASRKSPAIIHKGLKVAA